MEGKDSKDSWKHTLKSDEDLVMVFNQYDSIMIKDRIFYTFYKEGQRVECSISLNELRELAGIK